MFLDKYSVVFFKPGLKVANCSPIAASSFLNQALPSLFSIFYIRIIKMTSKKIIFYIPLLLSIFFTPLAATSADLSEILKKGEVTIAVPEAFPPFGSVGKSGKHEGYDVDVAKLIAKDLGVKLTLVPVVSKQRIPFLETDKVDLVISTMGANPKRAKSINFSSAYAPFFSGVFASSKMKITSYDDLDGMTIGVTGGTLEDLELTEKAPKGANIVRFGDNAATLSAIKSGQVQVLVAGNTAAASLTDADPSFDLKTKFIIKESPCFIGIKKGNEDLLRWVNVFILHKKLGGALNKISNKWLGQDLPPLPSL